MSDPYRFKPNGNIAGLSRSQGTRVNDPRGIHSPGRRPSDRVPPNNQTTGQGPTDNGAVLSKPKTINTVCNTPAHQVTIKGNTTHPEQKAIERHAPIVTAEKDDRFQNSSPCLDVDEPLPGYRIEENIASPLRPRKKRPSNNNSASGKKRLPNNNSASGKKRLPNKNPASGKKRLPNKNPASGKKRLPNNNSASGKELRQGRQKRVDAGGRADRGKAKTPKKKSKKNSNNSVNTNANNNQGGGYNLRPRADFWRDFSEDLIKDLGNAGYQTPKFKGKSRRGKKPKRWSVADQDQHVAQIPGGQVDGDSILKFGGSEIPTRDVRGKLNYNFEATKRGKLLLHRVLHNDIDIDIDNDEEGTIGFGSGDATQSMQLMEDVGMDVDGIGMDVDGIGMDVDGVGMDVNDVGMDVDDDKSKNEDKTCQALREGAPELMNSGKSNMNHRVDSHDWEDDTDDEKAYNDPNFHNIYLSPSPPSDDDNDGEMDVSDEVMGVDDDEMDVDDNMGSYNVPANDPPSIDNSSSADLSRGENLSSLQPCIDNSQSRELTETIILALMRKDFQAASIRFQEGKNLFSTTQLQEISLHAYETGEDIPSLIPGLPHLKEIFFAEEPAIKAKHEVYIRERKIQIESLSTYQGKVSGSISGCTVISACVVSKHMERDGGVINDQIKSVIDTECVPLLTAFREKNNETEASFLVLTDVVNHLICSEWLPERFGSELGFEFEDMGYGNITNPFDLRKLLNLLNGKKGKTDLKSGAIFLFREHVISIVKFPRSVTEATYDVVDSIPDPSTNNYGSRTHCDSIDALKVHLESYCIGKLSESDIKNIKENPIKNDLSDRGVFEYYVWIDLPGKHNAEATALHANVKNSNGGAASDDEFDDFNLKVSALAAKCENSKQDETGMAPPECDCNPSKSTTAIPLEEITPNTSDTVSDQNTHDTVPTNHTVDENFENDCGDSQNKSIDSGSDTEHSCADSENGYTDSGSVVSDDDNNANEGSGSGEHPNTQRRFLNAHGPAGGPEYPDAKIDLRKHWHPNHTPEWKGQIPPGAKSGEDLDQEDVEQVLGASRVGEPGDPKFVFDLGLFIYYSRAFWSSYDPIQQECVQVIYLLYSTVLHTFGNQSSKRSLRYKGYEWHHMYPKNIGGHLTALKNYIPLTCFLHVIIHFCYLILLPDNPDIKIELHAVFMGWGKVGYSWMYGAAMTVGLSKDLATKFAKYYSDFKSNARDNRNPDGTRKTRNQKKGLPKHAGKNHTNHDHKKFLPQCQPDYKDWMFHEIIRVVEMLYRGGIIDWTQVVEHPDLQNFPKRLLDKKKLMDFYKSQRYPPTDRYNRIRREVLQELEPEDIYRKDEVIDIVQILDLQVWDNMTFSDGKALSKTCLQKLGLGERNGFIYPEENVGGRGWVYKPVEWLLTRVEQGNRNKFHCLLCNTTLERRWGKILQHLKNNKHNRALHSQIRRKAQSK